MPQSPKVNYYREHPEHPLRRIQRSSTSRIILRSATSLPRPKTLLTRNDKTLDKWLDKREFGCDICDRKFFHKSAVEAHRLSHTATPPKRKPSLLLKRKRSKTSSFSSKSSINSDEDLTVKRVNLVDRMKSKFGM